MQASHTLQYFGTLGTGTIQGNTDFHHTDDHDRSLRRIKLLEREASKTFWKGVYDSSQFILMCGT